MQIVRTTESKIIPVYDSQTQVYTVSVCSKEAYEDVREELKNNRDKKIIEPFIYIDEDGNWSLGLSVTNKPEYYNEVIPDYLARWAYPITEKTRKMQMYCDVWYHAAKDGKMGKQIYSPESIPADATHIVEIHK